MTQVTTLRTLTLKSKLSFGKYGDLTVEQIIALKLIIGLHYLRYVYFNYSKITFKEEILLNVLKIEKRDLIQKPGTGSSKKLREKYYKTQNQVARKDASNMQKGVIDRKSFMTERKSILRSINQGG